MALADSWLTLKDACEIADISRILPTLVERGWTTPSMVAANQNQWDSLDLSEAEQAMWRIPLARWLSPIATDRTIETRQDLPRSQPSAGGSLKRALAAAQANHADQTLKVFREDVWARSTSHPHNSRVKTWETIARAREGGHHSRQAVTNPPNSTSAPLGASASPDMVTFPSRSN